MNVKNYESLGKRYRDQPADGIFAFFPFDQQIGERWEAPFEQLAAMAKPEQWEYQRPEFRKPGVALPILHNYLNNTFLRLQEQKKIFFTNDGRAACFNTGLQTSTEKDIFAVFSVNRNSQPDWFFGGFFDSYSKELNRFRPLPEIATYIDDPKDLVLDLRYDIDVNIGHIVEDEQTQQRLPDLLKGNPNLALAAIEGATKFLKQRVLRNYKTAVPFWYVARSKLQLLLPLCIIQQDKADLALVADRDDIGQVYRIRTVLRMDMAYSNARVITRPDREWLDP